MRDNAKSTSVGSTSKQVAHLAGPALDLKSISRRYDVRAFDPEVGAYVDHPAITSVAVHQGTVLVNGQAVANPGFGRDFVRFSHKTPTGYTSGVLSFTADGHAFNGRIYAGADEHTATAHDVSGAVPPTIFRTRIAKTGAVPQSGAGSFPASSPPEPPDSDASKWDDGMSLVFGYAFSTEGSLPTLICQLTDPAGQKDPADISTSVALSTDSKNNDSVVLTLPFDMSATQVGVEQYGRTFPGAFVLEIAPFGDSFRGELQYYDDAKAQLSSERYAWHGVAVQASSAATSREPSALVDTEKNMAQARAAPAAMMAAAAPSDPVELSVADLYSLQPDAQTLMKDQFAMLVDNMKWALANNEPTKDWDTTFFGETPPVLSQDRIDLIQKGLSFYTDRFAICYLGRAFDKLSGPSAPHTKLTDAQALNLDFYMRAGLSHETSYNTQTHGVFLQAFIQALPRLQEYIQDQSANPNDPNHDWAQKLYDQITTPGSMNVIVAKLLADGSGMELANRHSTILLALQPSGKLAQSYHEQIVNTTICRTVEHLDLSTKDKIKVWLGDSLQAFMDAVLSGQLKADDADTQASMTKSAEAIQEAVEKAGSMVDLAGELADLTVVAEGADFWKKLTNAQAKWVQRGFAFANVIRVVAVIGGLTQSIFAFVNWKNLSKEGKARAITAAVQTVNKIVKDLPELVDAVGEKAKWGFNQIGKLRTKLSTPEVTDDWRKGLDVFEAEEGESPLRAGSQELSGGIEGGALRVEKTSWSEVFDSTVGKVCTGIGIAAAAAMAVLSTLQFVADIRENKPIETKVLDGIVMAADFGVAICAVAGVLSSAMFIPVLGAVFAIIGLVAALIEMFHPPAQPPSPIELFMKDHLVPAVSGAGRWILDAPAGWTPDTSVPARNAYNPGT